MRTKYTKPSNPWAGGQIWTVQQAFRWGVKRESYPTHAGSLKFLKHDRTIWRVGRRKLNRFAVGTIRALGAPNFFRGCYHGAEND